MIRFGILEGSLRSASLSRAVARAATTLVPDGVTCIALPSTGTLHLYDQDLQDDGMPDSATAMLEAVASIDALLIVTPEYNWSMPGSLKNALDWISRDKTLPLAGKPVAIWSVSPGLLGGARVHEGLRHVLHSLDMLIMAKPEVQIAGAKDKVDVDASRITDPDTEGFLRAHLTDFEAFCTKWGAGAR